MLITNSLARVAHKIQFLSSQGIMKDEIPHTVAQQSSKRKVFQHSLCAQDDFISAHRSFLRDQKQYAKRMLKCGPLAECLCLKISCVVPICWSGTKLISLNRCLSPVRGKNAGLYLLLLSKLGTENHPLSTSKCLSDLLLTASSSIYGASE